MKRVVPDRKWRIALAVVCIASGTLTTSSVLVDKSDAVSARSLLLSEFLHDQSVEQFGLLTATGLDIRYNILGIRFEDNSDVIVDNVDFEDRFTKPTSGGPTDPSSTGPTGPTDPSSPQETTPVVIDSGPNVMDIQFNLAEKDSELLAMNLFFSNRQPTLKNEYTGRFKGKNLILITAEAFSMHIINPELTPTLYKLSTEGFVFNNFYTPIWNVSTASGEYVAMNGLLPDLGTIKYVVIQDRAMPFSFGHQFAKLGYSTKA
jgi:hypothetical protein